MRLTRLGPPRERKQKKELGYKLRQAVLERCGFSSYTEYLSSELWKDIRGRVLQRDERKCQACGHRATQVHHLSYGDVTIRGDKLDRLTSLCGACHRSVEFKGSGKKQKKRPFGRTKKALKNRRHQVRRARTRTAKDILEADPYADPAYLSPEESREAATFVRRSLRDQGE